MRYRYDFYRDNPNILNERWFTLYLPENFCLSLNIFPTKTITSILFAASALFFSSCSSGNNGENAGTKNDTAAHVTQPAYDNSLAKGTVTDSVICRSQNTQSYALYLPSYYSQGKPFPCIYFFDAHARGSLPVRTYKDIAERYGFVLVGSNVSKNGIAWPVTNEGVKALMEDTRTRINIDPKRIYTAGFSGGSRVASSVAIMDGGVAGVIGCAAGFPRLEQGIQNKFDYFGMVGDYDFNLTEMEQLDETLAQNGFTHQLLTSGGIHGWPPAADFQTALLWIQANAMKENLQPKNDTLITALLTDYDKRITAAKSSGDLIKTHELLEGMARVLDGLTDAAYYKKQSAELAASAGYKKAIALRAQLQEKEMNQQQELAKQFAAQDEKWWSNRIAELNRNIHSAKTQQESQMNKRVLNYLGLVGYMNTSHALSTGDLANAATYLKVFKMADPENPDCSYLSAVYYMKKGNPQQAIASLKEAASLGYSEVAQLITDPVFSGLQGDEGFKSVVNKARENNSGK